jgi:amidase
MATSSGPLGERACRRSSGYPHLTVPMGLVNGGLPAGLSFIGTADSDGLLLRAGYAYEQATQVARVAPLYLPSAPADLGPQRRR